MLRVPDHVVAEIERALERTERERDAALARAKQYRDLLIGCARAVDALGCDLVAVPARVRGVRAELARLHDEYDTVLGERDGAVSIGTHAERERDNALARAERAERELAELHSALRIAEHRGAELHDVGAWQRFVEALLDPADRKVSGGGAEQAVLIERLRCANIVRRRAEDYPTDLFPATGTSKDAIAGTALRLMLPRIADALLEEEKS